jgi:hypothetical protein
MRHIDGGNTLAVRLGRAAASVGSQIGRDAGAALKSGITGFRREIKLDRMPAVEACDFRVEKARALVAKSRARLENIFGRMKEGDAKERIRKYLSEHPK